MITHQPLAGTSVFPSARVPGTGERIAVVDDDPEDSYATSMVLRAAGYFPVEITPERESPDAMLGRVMGDCVAGVFDHRLNSRVNVPFTGADLASLARRSGFPAVLSSTYISRDQGTSIRLHRAEIPCLLDKSEQSPEALREAFEAIVAELRGDIPRERIAFPVVVEVREVHMTEEIPTAEVLIPAWKPFSAVQLPISIILADIRIEASRLPGTWLDAEVNCHAEQERDLFFRKFSLSPEPPSDWMTG